jgi:hypothetical protein
MDGTLRDEDAIAEDATELEACRARLLVHVCACEDRRDRLEVGRDEQRPLGARARVSGGEGGDDAGARTPRMA